ncbi:MAG TPA: diaminopimelate epimerase [Frankiaceae bacterium]|nr:diaminopimelate epimerase [Frankiaceae bacterium]
MDAYRGRSADARGGLPFLKGHGTGNDFVLLPDPEGRLELTPALVRRLCDRRFGIGADGVLRVVPVEYMSSGEVGQPDGARWFMDYHNADGSIAEMCGNGVRVYSRFLVDEGWEAAGDLLLATRGGTKQVHVPETGDITVDMGAPEVLAGPVQVCLGNRTFSGQPVSMGNPHLVVRLDDPEELASLDLTDDVRAPDDVFPTGVNLELYIPVELDGVPTLEMRVHERGVGETLSCGTGACAVAVAATGSPGPARQVRVPGGLLRVEWTNETLYLQGPAELVAEGRWLG